METLANQHLRTMTKPTESVKEEVVIKTDTGNNIEIDSAIVNQDGEIIQVGEIKLSDSPNAYFKAIEQIGKNWQYIQGNKGSVTEISTASGKIPPSKLDPETIDDAYTMAPVGGNAKLPQEIPKQKAQKLPSEDELTVQNRRSFTHTLQDSKEQIEMAHETFRGARET